MHSTNEEEFLFCTFNPVVVLALPALADPIVHVGVGWALDVEVATAGKPTVSSTGSLTDPHAEGPEATRDPRNELGRGLVWRV